MTYPDGMHAGISAEDYHADRETVSSSGLRKLLAPSCPAQFKWDWDNPPAPKKTFDVGHAAHKLALGEGPDMVVVDYERWDSKAAKAEVADARATGAVPLKRADFDQVHDMAAALRAHPLAGPLLAPGTGLAERSLYWTDPDTGVKCRARPDWLKVYDDMVLCVDYKTCADASPVALSRAIRDHAYHQQDPFYIDGIRAVLEVENVRFVFVFQSKTAPYLITVRELAEQDRLIGRARNNRALRLYAECENTGYWPDWTGPVTEIPTIGMPSWDTINQAEEYL